MSVLPDEVNIYLEKRNSAPISQKLKLGSILGRPNVSLAEIAPLFESVSETLAPYGVLGDEILEQVEIDFKYSGYLEKEREMADKMLRLEHIRFPESFDFEKIVNISTEARQKLIKIRPETLGQASRISGADRLHGLAGLILQTYRYYWCTWVDK